MANEIESLREEIKQINKEIIELIAERTDVAEQIGKIKKENDKAIRQPSQEKQVLEFCKQKAKNADLSPEDIVAVFEDVMAISRNRQHQEW